MALKGLFLHGLMQNSKMMAADFAPMKEKLSSLLEISYIDAPYNLETYPVFCQLSSEKADEELRKLEDQFRENHYKKHGKKEHYEKTWYYTSFHGYYSPQMKDAPVVGLEESLELVLNECKTNKVDGLVGFSQGSLLSTILTKKTLNDPSLGWKPKFCLLFGAPMPFVTSLAQLITSGPKMDVPSLHVMGKADKLVPNSRSLMLSECFVNPVIHYHEGGHTVPHNDDLSVYEKFFSNL